MSDWLDIAGRVYVVTGGSSGIGKAIVTELLSDGACVANFDIHESDISNNNYLFVETDVTNRTSVDCAIRSTVARFGTIDGLVNNAGINLPRLLVDLAHPNGDYELTDISILILTCLTMRLSALKFRNVPLMKPSLLLSNRQL